MGVYLYQQLAKSSYAHKYNENGTTSEYSFTTREVLSKRSDTNLSYKGLIGGYYREVDLGSYNDASASAVDESSEGSSTAYWQAWMDSSISYNSLSSHFGVNGTARPFGNYDSETGSLTGISTATTYRAGEVSTGYRVYIESYLETSNTEISVWQNYEIKCDVYLTSELEITSISTTFLRASDSNWDSKTHSIKDKSSLTSSRYEISNISWGEIPSYDDENPLLDFSPYYVSTLTDIDIVDTIDGWHGSDGNPAVGDYYEMPNLASKMSYEPSTALDYSDIDITSVSPAGAVEVNRDYGKFLSGGEVTITFGTPANPNLLTKTYIVEGEGEATLASPCITYFDGDLVEDTSTAHSYFASLSEGEEKTFTAVTNVVTNQTLDMSLVSVSFDSAYISVFYTQSYTPDGKVIYFSVSALEAGTTILNVICPDATGSGTNTWAITITITA